MLEFINLTTKADPTAATCLLKLDAAYVLLDPGATDVLRVPEWTTRLVEMGIRPDLILLSHADLRHIGALVYGFHKLGWDQSAMYATLPVATMGRLAMHDAVSSTLPPDPSEPDYADMVHITPAMIDAAFDNLITLRYSQPANLSGKEPLRRFLLLTQTSSLQRGCHHRIQCRTFARWGDMENRQGPREHCLCCQLEPCT